MTATSDHDDRQLRGTGDLAEPGQPSRSQLRRWAAIGVTPDEDAAWRHLIPLGQELGEDPAVIAGEDAAGCE